MSPCHHVTLGRSQAQFQLGRCYARGHGGMALEPRKAQALFRKASAQGHAKAMEELKELEKKTRHVELVDERTMVIRDSFYTYTIIYTYSYIYIYIYMHVYIYIYIYLYTQTHIVTFGVDHCGGEHDIIQCNMHG